MGIYSAMGIAISGMKGQSFALGHISGNIANSQTTGFKRTETSFADLVPGSTPNRQIPGGVNAFTRGTNDIGGDVSGSSTPTHMGINGDGFFIVGQRTGQADGEPIIGEGNLFTRRGDFAFDRSGHLVNGGGYYLKGIPMDAATGNPAGGEPETVRISNDFLAAQKTTQVTLRANLPSTPHTARYDPDDPGSELMDVVNPGDTVTGDDKDAFLEQSISGGAITVYDDAGDAHNLQLRWAKVDDDPDDRWNLFYLTDPDAGAGEEAWINAGPNNEYAFDENGRLTEPATGIVELEDVTIKGAVVGDITINHGQNGLTQFADSNGSAKTTEFRQNGFAAGELVDVSISDSGRIVGTYSNGNTIDLYDVRLASFNAPNRLEKLDGGAFRATADSGEAILGADGSVLGSALESSNTDIAEEFTKLIVTQQAYSAGTRVVTTGNEMMTEVLNMIR